MPETIEPWQSEFLQTHQLDETYLLAANRRFQPLVASLAAYHSENSVPLLVAMNGSQGSGKSTLCDYLVAALGSQNQLVAVSLSLDDFYCTRVERKQLSKDVHPLLATRGVPGTHDISLLNSTLDALLEARPASTVRVPRFNKARDERRSESEWDVVSGAVDIVILEGWCLGARPQNALQLASPVNTLEEIEDEGGVWRSYVNEVLRKEFLPLYERVDQWIMLQAPSFDCVYRWRLEQEHKLAAGLSPDPESNIMDDNEIARFIQYYQRLTQQCVQFLPAEVNHLFQLDEHRHVEAYHFSISQSVLASW